MQQKLEVSPETYVKVRQKQAELIQKTHQHINLKDITNIAIQTIIDSVNIESDEKGWILTAGVNETIIQKETPIKNIMSIKNGIAPTLKRVKMGDICDGCGKDLNNKIDCGGTLIDQCRDDIKSKLLCNECIENITKI